MMLITTGDVDGWDQFIAAPAALSTGGLVLFAFWGYSRLPTKRPVDFVHFGAVLATVASFFWVIFWMIAPPRYLTLITLMQSTPVCYSCRSAIIGSTALARRAGT